jgi:prepilin-type N-terminal cleavage/methylation domain-containing protein
MSQSLNRPKTHLRQMRGFSLTELLIVMAVILIVTAIAVPSFVRATQNYRLTDVASQVAGIMKSARFEAIRENNRYTWRISQAGNTTTVWDADVNGVVDATEKLAIFNTNINVVAAGGVPNTAGLATAITVQALTAVTPANATLTFDSRGSVTGAPAAYAVYVSDAPNGGTSFRAVILLPSGITQIWSAPAAGTWQQLY